MDYAGVVILHGGKIHFIHWQGQEQNKKRHALEMFLQARHKANVQMKSWVNLFKLINLTVRLELVLVRVESGCEENLRRKQFSELDLIMIGNVIPGNFERNKGRVIWTRHGWKDTTGSDREAESLLCRIVYSKNF